MNADTGTEYDQDEIDDRPSQMGRTPIGPAIQVQFSKEAHLALCAAAEPFGQRRGPGRDRPTPGSPGQAGGDRALAQAQ